MNNIKHTIYRESGRRRNAFAPYIVLNAIVDPLLLGVMFLSKADLIKDMLTGIVCFNILFAAFIYWVMLNKDPKMLQSENYKTESMEPGSIHIENNVPTIETIHATKKLNGQLENISA